MGWELGWVKVTRERGKEEGGGVGWGNSAEGVFPKAADDERTSDEKQEKKEHGAAGPDELAD